LFAANVDAATLCRPDLTLASTYHRPTASAPSKPTKPGIKSGVADNRPWRIVGGPELTASQLHCATVPDGPDCEWKGGEYQRIEARNRALLRELFRKQAADRLIQPHHPPVNVLDGYRFPDAPIINLSPVATAPAPAAVAVVIGDGFDIPEFLRRTSLNAGGNQVPMREAA
jgi:hypothetical protein